MSERERFVQHALDFILGNHDLGYLAQWPTGPDECDRVSWRHAWRDVGNFIWRKPDGMDDHCSLALTLAACGDAIVATTGLDNASLLANYLASQGCKVVTFSGRRYAAMLPSQEDSRFVVFGTGTGDMELTVDLTINYLTEIKERWDKCRDYLLGKLSEAIEAFELKSGRNFDRACAFNGQTLDIVIADQVIIVCNDGRNLLFDGSVFTQHKLRRPQNHWLMRCRMGGPSVFSQRIGSVRSGKLQCVFLDGREMPVPTTCFIAAQSCLTGPLPAGGVLV